MQISLHRRSRLEGFLGPFFLVQLVFWLQALSAMAAQRFSRPHEASWRHRASRGFMASTAAQDSLDLVTRATSATALATALATRFSSNSYVFL